MSRDQNTGRSHNIKTDNNSFERVDDFKYLGTAITNQKSVQEEIKGRLKSESACYHLVQNLCFPVAIQSFKDEDIENYNFTCCFVWVRGAIE
jgi:hypothetical protein